MYAFPISIKSSQHSNASIINHFFKTDFRDRGWERERKRERNIDLLFHLFVQPLVDSYRCSDRGLNPQPWPIGTMLSNLLRYPARASLTFYRCENRLKKAKWSANITQQVNGKVGILIQVWQTCYFHCKILPSFEKPPKRGPQPLGLLGTWLHSRR